MRKQQLFGAEIFSGVSLPSLLSLVSIIIAAQDNASTITPLTLIIADYLVYYLGVTVRTAPTGATPVTGYMDTLKTGVSWRRLFSPGHWKFKC